MGPRRLLIHEKTIPAFINEVKKRECIWNHESENYNDRYESMIAWREIAQAMDQPEDVLKSKWKNLRDLFKREMKRWTSRMPINSVEDYKGKWKFFGQMWFIHKPGDVVVNDHTEDSNEELFDYAEDDDEEDNPLQTLVKFEPPDREEQIYVDVDADPTSHATSSRKRKREDDSDFDMMFLKSLTPYFRQLDPMRKLIARSKIQDILINEMAVQQTQNNKNNSKNNT